MFVYFPSLAWRRGPVNFPRLLLVSPRVNTEDLIGAAEVAEILGLKHHNSVTTYVHRYEDFPKPVVDISQSRIRLWLRQEIEEWAEERRRG